jgi:RHS repeat-associated protein
LIYRNDPNRGEAIYQYNAFGDLISEKHQNVYEIKYTHDTLGRPVQKKVLDIPTNTEEITTWTWDTAPHGLGRLATAQTNEGHSESYEYDSLGHLVRTKTKPSIPGESRGIPTTYTTTYEYQAGRLYAIRYPATPTEPPLSVYYHYSEEGILSSIYAQSSLLGRSSLIWRLEEVDEQGRMKLEQTGNGLRNEYGFDPLNGLLTQLKTFQSDGTTLQHFSYAYDKNRNLSFQSNLIQNQSESFLHDALDRLSRSTIQSTTGTNDTTDFEYFSNGNIKRIKKPSKFSFFGGAVWKYDPAHPHAVREAIRDNQTYTFEYDLLGRQIRRSSSMIPGDSRYLGYTSFDKPRWISPTLDPNDPKAVRFSYDAHQQRILKDSSSEQTLYIQGIYEKKIDKTTNQITLRRHITNGSRVIATLTAIRTPQQQEWLSQIHYLHTDRLGSPTLISDAEGKVEEYRSYDAFGRRRDPKDWRLSNSSPPSLLTSGFTGHEEDDELGLINMKGRIYDPTIARFLSPDPVVAVPQFSQSWNRYSYVFNAPLSFVDPSGFNPVPTEEELFRYEVAQEALKNGCPSGLECSGHQKTVEEFEKNYPQPSPVAAPNSPATTPNSNDSFGSSASPIDHYTNDLQELEQAGSAVLGLTFGILQGAIPFAGFVPSNNADNAAYESARAVGNIIGGAISIAYGLGATATGGGAGPGLMVAGKGGAALLSGYRALSMAGAVAVAGSGTGAVAGALSGARNALHNGKPQPLLMAGSNKASVIGDSGSSGPSDTRIGVLEISPKGSRIALGSYNTSKDHKGLRDKVLGKPNDLDTKQLGLILDQEKIHIVTPHSSTGFTTSSQDIPLIETALRQADLIHPNGTIVLISGQKPFIIRP